jgi:hypothetical protein
LNDYSPSDAEPVNAVAAIAREVLRVANEAPLEYVGLGHMNLAHVIHPYMPFPITNGLQRDRLVSSFWRGQEQFARRVIRVIAEELDRLGGDLRGAENSPGLHRKYSLQLYHHAAGTLVSTRARITRVAALLGRSVHPDDQDIIEVVDSAVGPEVRGLLERQIGLTGAGTKTREADRAAKTRRPHPARPVRKHRRAGRPGRLPPLTITSEWIEDMQDASLLHYHGVASQLRSLGEPGRREQSFKRGDLEMLQLVLRDRFTSWEHQGSRPSEEVVRGTEGLDELVTEILDQSSDDTEKVLVTLSPGDGDGVKVRRHDAS